MSEMLGIERVRNIFRPNAQVLQLDFGFTEEFQENLKNTLIFI